MATSSNEWPSADSARGMKQQLGFTRVETALVLVLMCSLVAIVIPIAKRELVFAQGATARSQTEEVARAITMLLKDTRMPPAQGGYGSFVGTGTAPQDLESANLFQLDALASKTTPPRLRGSILGTWKGPYLKDVLPDPWGNAIVVTAVGDPELYIWCVSAGPNGILETTANDRFSKGDDIATRVY
ncbi:MAG: hypothetical protein ACKVS6_00330 [Planctomycetota bacterium]